MYNTQLHPEASARRGLTRPQGAYPLASKARAGADGAEVLLLPLLSYVVRLPIVIAGGLICEEKRVGSTCETESSQTDASPAQGWLCPWLNVDRHNQNTFTGVVRSREPAA